MNSIIKTVTKTAKTLTNNSATNTFLQNKVVLYIVLFLAITNIFVYLMLKELNAVLFFLLVPCFKLFNT